MPEVSVSVNGRIYRIACAEGEQEHVAALGAEIDHRAHELVAQVGQVSEGLLLTMLALLLADDLHETRAALGRARQDLPDPDARARVEAAEHAAATSIEALAARLEAVAERIERA